MDTKESTFQKIEEISTVDWSFIKSQSDRAPVSSRFDAFLSDAVSMCVMTDNKACDYLFQCTFKRM